MPDWLPAALIGGFLVALVLIALTVAHLIERAARFRIDLPD